MAEGGEALLCRVERAACCLGRLERLLVGLSAALAWRRLPSANGRLLRGRPGWATGAVAGKAWESLVEGVFVCTCLSPAVSKHRKEEGGGCLGSAGLEGRLRGFGPLQRARVPIVEIDLPYLDSRG